MDLRESITARLGAADKTVTKKELRNVGPSITYKLRDAAGQAREFHNYMLPVDLGEGVPLFLLGMRENPSDAFRYLRVPADAEGGMAGLPAPARRAGRPRPARGGGAPLCAQRHRSGAARGRTATDRFGQPGAGPVRG